MSSLMFLSFHAKIVYYFWCHRLIDFAVCGKVITHKRVRMYLFSVQDVGNLSVFGFQQF